MCIRMGPIDSIAANHPYVLTFHHNLIDTLIDVIVEHIFEDNLNK